MSGCCNKSEITDRLSGIASGPVVFFTLMKFVVSRTPTAQSLALVKAPALVIFNS
jgi:hypothetical protein